MKRKISRKFLAAVVGAASLLLADVAGVSISPETQTAIITLLGLWIAGEATVDAADRIGQRRG